jgi:hypothetical protein
MCYLAQGATATDNQDEAQGIGLRDVRSLEPNSEI